MKREEQGGEGPRRPLCVYIDNSNIFIGGRELAKSKGEDPLAFRLDFSNFIRLITDGTGRFDDMVWAGSGGDEVTSLFSEVQNWGARMVIIPPGEGGEHETVDAAIQLAMYRNARKYRDSPGVIVLCTGDGKGTGNEEGFLYDLKGFVEDGWQVVLYSWDSVCHEGLKKFVSAHGHYVALEPYYLQITFLQSGRSAQPLHLHAHSE